jgi:hypothetical protein
LKLVSGKIAASVALVALVALAASAAMLSSADAAEYCYNATNGGSDCGFTSMEQCQATAIGQSGTCTHALNWSAAPGLGGSYAYYRGARDPNPVAPRGNRPTKAERASQ